MDNIIVHVLNFHGIFSHIEIVLENTSTRPHSYYGINRWEEPSDRWSYYQFKSYIDEASSIYSFDIKANRRDIVQRWRNYWYETDEEASILGKKLCSGCSVVFTC